MSKILIALCCILYIVSGEMFYSITTKKVTEKPTGSTPQEFAENLRNAVVQGSTPQGYCFKRNPTFPLNNNSLCGGPKKNIGWIFSFVFEDAEAAEYEMQFGTDFGWGAAIWIDKKFYSAEMRDMWWANNWNSKGVFRLKQSFNAGRHEILVIGAEGCCDGKMDVQFNRNSTGYKELSTENLEEEIPKPDVSPRPSYDGAPDCKYSWTCDEYNEYINSVCPQTDKNEYIECAVQIIDTQLESCSEVEVQPSPRPQDPPPRKISEDPAPEKQPYSQFKKEEVAQEECETCQEPDEEEDE